jgi:hypothetical protein
MLSKIGRRHPLRKLFGGLVEQVFMSELGICDPRLTDYLSDLLIDFVHIDTIYRLRTVDGQVIREVSCAEAEAYLGPAVAGSTRRRIVNRYIGDFTLFWSGVYPESLRTRRSAGDRLHEYLVQGKRSYGIASELSAADADPPADLLEQLSQEFESCVHGLHLVRHGWERLPASTRHN